MVKDDSKMKKEIKKTEKAQMKEEMKAAKAGNQEKPKALV